MITEPGHRFQSHAIDPVGQLSRRSHNRAGPGRRWRHDRCRQL